MPKPVNAYRNKNFNEGTANTLSLTSLDNDNQLAIPSAIEYRIDDLTNSRQVKDWTSLVVTTAKNDIVITTAENQLRSRGRPREMRQVAVKTTDTNGATITDTFIYTLIRVFNREEQLT